MSYDMPLDSEVYYYTIYDLENTDSYTLGMGETSLDYFLSEDPYANDSAPHAYFEYSEIAMPCLTDKKAVEHVRSEDRVEQQNVQPASPTPSPVRRATHLFLFITFVVLYIVCFSLLCLLNRTDENPE
jgi:hypothetical protein